MAYFKKFELTKNGEKLLNEAIANKKVIVFTKIKLGEGKNLDSNTNLNDLKKSFKEIAILKTDVLATDKVLKIKGYFDNNGFLEDKKWNEIGVFAKIQDDPSSEIMYSYSETEVQDEIIPSEKKGKFKRTLNILNYISSASLVTFNITELKDRYSFNSIAELKIATFLRKGDKVELWGKNTLGDYTTYNLIVEDIKKSGIDLNNGLFANKVSDTDGSLKLNKGGYNGTAEDLNNEISKIASTTHLGRIKVGKNLSIDSNGFLNAKDSYTHPSGNGNSHIPVNGSIGQFIKWVSSGVGQWAQITWNDITGIFPASNHKHNTLRIRNGFNYIEYDGSTSQEINIQVDGGTPGVHAHSTNDIAYLSGYNKGTYSGALTTTDSLNRALAKLENNLDGKASLEELTNKANLNHSHGSNNITYMTGYSKAGSYSQINAYDSLNVAIGKLEKGLEEKANADMLASKADINHSHGSNNITYMTGYSKDYSGGAISPSDSLNKAVGKLEKNLDNKADLDHTHSQYATSEDVSASLNNKYDKTGGTISGNVVVTGNEVVNGSVSCNSIILNGYTITIE